MFYIGVRSQGIRSFFPKGSDRTFLVFWTTNQKVSTSTFLSCGRVSGAVDRRIIKAPWVEFSAKMLFAFPDSYFFWFCRSYVIAAFAQKTLSTLIYNANRMDLIFSLNLTEASCLCAIPSVVEQSRILTRTLGGCRYYIKQVRTFPTRNYLFCVDVCIRLL